MGSFTQDAELPHINLQLGWPTPSLFAREQLLKGSQSILSSPAETALALVYGPHPGYIPLRKEVAKWLSEIYSPASGPIDFSRIIISNGASCNLANILQKFADATYTRRIFMVEPTYFLACPIFEDGGFKGKLQGIPEDAEEGLDIEYLRRVLQEAESERAKAVPNPDDDVPRLKTGPNFPHVYKYIVYMVPTYSNPSAKTMSLHRRKQVVELAREYDALVVTDDVYDMLSWPADPALPDDAVGPIPPRLVDLDRSMPGRSDFGNTVSNGSFSKIVGPGVRVGWAESTKAFADLLGEVGSSSSGGNPGQLSSMFVHHMLAAGTLQTHIKNELIPTYRKRYYVLMSAIRKDLVPLGIEIEVGAPYQTSDSSQTTYTETVGGFFTYLRLPPGMPFAREVAAHAMEKYNLKVAFGHMFKVWGDNESTTKAESPRGFGHCVRLCWAWHTEEELIQGVRRLASVILEMREGAGASNGI
ncbi:aminotransferase [Lophium mytilinum]|uniref:Aminotransferase n=1 Tax=Lophium mytilinum TaxID=390894 RepID=A0A6A6QXI4_9PEZI|nr:aminotransferase [Lophium mytilinum]